MGTSLGFLRRLAFHGGPEGGIVNHFNSMIGFFSFRNNFYKHPGQDRRVGFCKRKMYNILSKKFQLYDPVPVVYQKKDELDKASSQS